MPEKTNTEQQPTFSELVNASDAFIAKNRACITADALDELHFVLKGGEDYRIVMDKGPDVISSMIREETMKVFKGFKIPDHLLSSGSVIANSPVRFFPSRAVGENEGRVFIPTIVPSKNVSRRRYLSAKREKPTGGWPSNVLSNGEVFLIPIKYVTDRMVPHWTKEYREKLQSDFQKAMAQFDHRNHFTIGIDLCLVLKYNLSNESSPAFARPLIKGVGFKVRNFKKAYSGLIEKIKAVSF